MATQQSFSIPPQGSSFEIPDCSRKRNMEDFVKYSSYTQNIHYGFLEGKEYDVLMDSELHHFGLILSNYIQSKEVAIKLSKQITNSHNLYYRIIIVNCLADDNMFSVPVIRVKNENQAVFYDLECREYKNWEDFLSNNHLPKCLMKFPQNGMYKMEDGKLMLEERKSPACSTLKAIGDGLYVLAKVGAILASVALDFKSMQPYNKAIGVVSGACNTYTTGYHASKLCDRTMHGQSIHYSNEGAAGHWISISSGVLLFSITVGKIKWGSPHSEEIAFRNLIALSKMAVEGDVMSGLEKIQTCLVSQHLTYFTNKAVEYFEKKIIDSCIDVKELIFNLRRYVLCDNFVSSKFRRFVSIDNATLTTVARDTAFAKKIPRLFRMELYNINIELNKTVDKIMKEVRNWANGNASIMQLIFRVTGLCNGSKSYETVEEICKYFNVNQPEDIQVNDKFLFKDSRKKYLELLNTFDINKFPQLLSYIVEYLSNHDNDDIEEFKKSLNEKVINEMDVNVLPQVAYKEKEWINALTLENLSYAHSVPHEGTQLVKPKIGNETEITLCDLFKLAKRLLGRVGAIDMKLVSPDVDWVIVASKRCNFAVIIAPKMLLEDFTSISGCYPVFKRPL